MNTSDTSDNQISLDRYRPQIRLPQLGKEGQTRLLKSRVLVIGCGALGSVAAVFLAAAGVGNIDIADFDTVDESNLHRQVFYNSDDCGKKKAETLALKIRRLNPQIKVTPYDILVREDFLVDLLPQIDFVVDAADNPQTTYLIDRICSSFGVGYVTAGISGWKAQILTFRRGSVTFGQLFPAPDNQSSVLPCSIEGVFGPLAGMVASIQASETIKSLLDVGRTLTDTLLTVDLLDNRFVEFPLSPSVLNC